MECASSRVDEFYSKLDDRCTQISKQYKAARKIYSGKSAGKKIPAMLLSKNKSNPTVAIVARLHGNEEFATEGAFRTMERIAESDFLDKYNAVVVPCVNIYGAAMKKRENADGIDLNRNFEANGSPESTAILGLIKEYRPVALFDYHDTLGSTKSFVIAVPPEDPDAHRAMQELLKQYGRNAFNKRFACFFSDFGGLDGLGGAFGAENIYITPADFEFDGVAKISSKTPLNTIIEYAAGRGIKSAGIEACPEKYALGTGRENLEFYADFVFSYLQLAT